jgi:hypothetical protein
MFVSLVIASSRSHHPLKPGAPARFIRRHHREKQVMPSMTQAKQAIFETARKPAPKNISHLLILFFAVGCRHHRLTSSR